MNTYWINNTQFDQLLMEHKVENYAIEHEDEESPKGK